MPETQLVTGLPRFVGTAPPLAASAKPIEPDLTDDEILVLTFIARSPNCSRHEMAVDLRLTLSRCERAIRGLEKKGLIEYTGDASKTK